MPKNFNYRNYDLETLKDLEMEENYEEIDNFERIIKKKKFDDGTGKSKKDKKDKKKSKQ
jgi:hypothetical protein